MNLNPLVSIITVSYNAVSVIEETILSVIHQTYENIEYIIIDGGSTDGTVDIIQKYQDRLAYWVSEPDEGIYDAMNKGVQKVSGEWVNYMNAGDSFFSKHTIKDLVDKLSSEFQIVYGNTIIWLNSKGYLQYPKPLELIKYQMVFGHQATFVKREVLLELQFNTVFRSSGDYDFFYRAYKKGKVFKYIPITIANYEGEQGMSIRNYLLARYEDAQIQGINKKLSWRLSFACFNVMYRFKKFLKSLLPYSLLRKIQDRRIVKRINSNKL